jgi:hypothetical protein
VWPTDRRLVPLLVTTVLVCAIAVGCGDDGDADAESGGGETAAAARLPDAKQSPEAFARRLATLVADTISRKDCEDLDAINGRSLYRFECPSPDAVRSELAFLKVRDAATFGTGAVVDYRTEQARQGASMVLFLSPDREWGLSNFGLIIQDAAESSDEDSREGYAEAMRGYLDAIRERDCKGYTRYAAIETDDLKAACKPELAAAKRLTQLLNRNRAEPQYLGGNGTYGFYRLVLSKPAPTYLTFSVIKTPKGSLRPYLVQRPTFAPAG